MDRRRQLSNLSSPLSNLSEARKAPDSKGLSNLSCLGAYSGWPCANFLTFSLYVGQVGQVGQRLKNRAFASVQSRRRGWTRQDSDITTQLARRCSEEEQAMHAGGQKSVERRSRPPLSPSRGHFFLSTANLERRSSSA